MSVKLTTEKQLLMAVKDIEVLTAKNKKLDKKIKEQKLLITYYINLVNIKKL